MAILVQDPSLLEDPELVHGVCAAAGLSLSNQRLQAQLRARLLELQKSRARIVEVGDAERRRLERDLHDGASSGLFPLRWICPPWEPACATIPKPRPS